jgi:hypothetical protein
MGKSIIKFRYGMILLIAIMLLSCSSTVQGQTPGNPPAPGFNLAGSDAKAIAIADEVMEKLGGRENWDKTRYITWRFFGRRLHVWDKWTGNARIESGKLIILMNLNTKDGRAWQDGQEVTHPDSLKKELEKGYAAWINDSYWVFMPYKLKDSGVTLKYHGEGMMADSSAADILELTFENTGLTPENKYLVYVDKTTRLVGQWDFFSNASDAAPRMSTPWKNWQKLGSIMLSDDRGRGKHSDLAVFDELPATVFESPEAVELQGMKTATPQQ